MSGLWSVKIVNWRAPTCGGTARQFRRWLRVPCHKRYILLLCVKVFRIKQAAANCRVALLKTAPIAQFEASVTRARGVE